MHPEMIVMKTHTKTPAYVQQSGLLYGPRVWRLARLSLHIVLAM